MDNNERDEISENKILSEKEKLIVEYLKKHKNKTMYPIDLKDYFDIADYYNWDDKETILLTQKMIEKGILKMNNKARDEISAKLWELFCTTLYKFHFRKMAKFKTQEIIEYLENMTEFELKIYVICDMRRIPSRKFAFHKDFTKVYWKIEGCNKGSE